VKKALRFLFWAVLLLATYVYGKFQGGYASWFMFYCSLLLCVYETLTARYAMRHTYSERKLSTNKLTAGQSLDVEILLEVEGKWPHPWVMIEDSLPTRLLLQSGSSRELHFPGFNRKMLLSYTLPNMPRGKYTLGDTYIQTGDVFGLFRKETVHSRKDDVTVYPKVVPIKYWHTVNKFNTGNSYAQNRMSEDSSNVIGVRDYAAGDRLSRIHWRASARTGQLKTKEFELHVTNDLMFFLNRSEQAYMGGSNQLFEMAVTTCASLAKYAVTKKYSVGLVSFGREKLTIPSNRNLEQYMRIIEHLAIVQPDSGNDFHEVVLKESNYLARGATAILVTPVLDDQLVNLIGFLEYRKIKAELFYMIGGRQVTDEDHVRIGKLSIFGVQTYLVRDENELEDIVRGPMNYASNS
jgi:uncharacterized protein (DUF58 family)